jgi:UDP-glucose 4-epimerase
MAVLVTGGAGYIGSHMVLELRARGEQVVVLDNLSTGQRWLLPDDVPLFVGSTGDETLVRSVLKAFRIDTVIHFAASIVVPESVSDPLGYYRNNTVNSRSLIESATSAGVDNFIFSSTAAVYGEPAVTPVPEDAPKTPTSPYGSSKLMTEIMLRDAAAATGLRYVVLRYFNVAGADPQMRTGQSTPQATHLIKVAAQAALGMRDHLDVYGQNYPTPDGTCVRDYIHVTDLVRAHSAAMDHLRGGHDSATLNCGYGRGFSVREVVDTVKKVSGVDFAVRQADRRPGDPAQIVAAAGEIRERLGWRPELDDLETIVDHALRWERNLLARATHPATQAG